MNPFDVATVPLAGVSVVEASAGTGKTYAVSTLVVRAIVELELPLDRIVVMTYTDAATQELRSRIRQRIGEALAYLEGKTRDTVDPVLANCLEGAKQDSGSLEQASLRLRAALSLFDQAMVSTIHVFCMRLLADYAFELGARLGAELQPDIDHYDDETLTDYWTRCLSKFSLDEVESLGLRRRFSLTELRKCWTLLVRAYPDGRLLSYESAVSAAEREALAQRLVLAARDARDVFDPVRLGEAVKSDALNQTKFRPSTNEKRLLTLQTWFDAERYVPSKEVCEALERFSTSYIQDNRKGSSKKPPPSDPFFARAEMVHQIALQYAKEVDQRVAGLWGDAMTYMRDTASERRREHGAVGFADLLLTVRSGLRDNEPLCEKIRQRFPFVLVDEFQDTDDCQFEILEAVWGKDSNMFLIGDPKQSIYGFRGADVHSYLRAARSVPEHKKYSMNVNYRSDPAMVAAVGALFAREDCFVVDDLHYVDVCSRPGAQNRFRWNGEVAPALVLATQGKTVKRQRLIDYCVDEVVRTLECGTIDGKAVVPEDIAVLVDSNRNGQLVVAALRASGVPAAASGDGVVFDQGEAVDLARIFAAAAEPGNATLVRRALATPTLGVSVNELAAMMDGEDETSSVQWESWVVGFHEVRDLSHDAGVLVALRVFMRRHSVYERLLSLPDGKRHVTNLEHLMQLCDRAARDERLGLRGLGQWLARQRGARRSDDSAVLRLVDDAAVVSVTTIHKSKGLEFPVVLCPFASSVTTRKSEWRSYHGPSPEFSLMLDLAPDLASSEVNGAIEERREAAAVDVLAEDVRRLYVAATRAKHRCVIVAAPVPSAWRSGLSFLLSGHKNSVKAPAWPDQCEALASVDEESVGVRRVDFEGLAAQERRAYTSATEEEAIRLVRPPISGDFERSHRVVSFTQLVAETEYEVLDGRDYDAIAPAAPSDVTGSFPITLTGFPRGARAGNFFHEILEDLVPGESGSSPLAQPPGEANSGDDTLRTTVEKHVHKYGYEAHWVEAVVTALREVLQTPLLNSPGPPSVVETTRAANAFLLESLDPESAAAELGFFFPVAMKSNRVGRQLALSLADVVEGEAATLHGSHLSAILMAHGSADVRRYAPALATIGSSGIRGFLKGYIDLIAKHDGRYYVVDYKTNHLGDDLTDYRGAGLARAMDHGNYHLQYLLYVIAVHRHLKQRVRDYDYRRDFGGVLYLFLKGMHPEHPGSGIYFTRPSRRLVEALDRTLREPPNGSAVP